MLNFLRCLAGAAAIFLFVAAAPDLGAAEEPAGEAAATALDDKLDFSAGLYVRNMYDMAAQEYLSLIEDYPQHSKIDQAYFGLAESYFFAKKYEEARERYREFLKLFKNHAKTSNAELRLGESLYHLGAKQEALGYFLKLADSSDDRMLLTADYFAGRILVEQKKWEEARRHFEAVMQVLSKNPFRELSQYYLGEIGLETGKLDDAEQAYQALLDSESEEIKQLAYFGLGKNAFGREDYQSAHRYFEKAFQSGPDPAVSEDAFLNDLKALLNLSHFDAIKEKLTEKGSLLQTRAKRIAAQILLGNANVMEGRYVEAVDAYKEVLVDANADESQVEEALLGQIEAWILAADSESALKALAQMELPVVRAQDRFLYLQIEAYKGVENWRASLDAMQTLLENYPDSEFTAQALLNRGYLLLEDHNLAEARSAFYDFGEKFPDHPMRAKVHEDAIQVSIEMNDWTLAIEDALYFLEHFPKHPHARSVHYQLGALYSERGEYEEAHQTFLKHLDQYGDSELEKDLSFRMGYNLQRQQKWQESLEPLAKVKKEFVDPELYAAALERRAFASVQLGLTEDAIELYREIIRDYPENRVAPEVYIWTAQQLGEKQDAAGVRAVLEAFQQKAGWEDYADDVFYYLAESHRVEYQCDEALPFYAKSKKAGDNFFVRALLGEGRCFVSLQRYEEGVKVLKTALKEAGSDHELAVRARMLLAELESTRGNPLEAAKGYFAIAILYEDPATVPDALMSAAKAFLEADKKEEALQALRELISRFPDHQHASEAAKQIAELA